MNHEYSLTDKSNTWQFFNRIAKRYDLLNRLLSFGTDVRWRKKVARQLPKRDALTGVDLGTGTGDFMFSLIDQTPAGKFAQYVGIDPADQMLEVGRQKAQRRGTSIVSFNVGDATQLDVPDNYADVVTMSFAIRNVPDVSACLQEINRILKPGGAAYILEFSIPQNPVIRWGYLVYFRHILPLIGGLLSGDRQAYRYLNESVEAFPFGDAFTQLMTEAGLSEVNVQSLTFGVASLYRGTSV